MNDLKQYIPFDKWIAKDDMVVGKLYFCKGRNFTLGTWNGTDFDYIREKFGMSLLDTEQHWDDGAPHGTVKPFKLVK